jgi:hypothetical protein
MTYQEKIKKAEECFQLILQGQSLAEINIQLKNEGLNYIDLSKVMKSIEVHIIEKYENIAKTSYETFKDFLNNWKDSHIATDVRELVFNHILEKHITEKKTFVNSRLHKNIPIDWVIDEAKDEYFSSDDITEYIEKKKMSSALDQRAKVSDPDK